VNFIKSLTKKYKQKSVKNFLKLFHLVLIVVFVVLIDDNVVQLSIFSVGTENRDLQ
jgi:capsule polysaccharide export protein KpsE/RkpR